MPIANFSGTAYAATEIAKRTLITASWLTSYWFISLLKLVTDHCLVRGINSMYVPNFSSPPFKNITLDSKLEMAKFAPWISIWEVMDNHKEPSCYTYI